MQTSQARQLLGFGGKGAYYAGGTEGPEGVGQARAGVAQVLIPVISPVAEMMTACMLRH